MARGVGEKGFAGGEESPVAVSRLAFVEVDFAVSLESCGFSAFENFWEVSGEENFGRFFLCGKVFGGILGDSIF